MASLEGITNWIVIVYVARNLPNIYIHNYLQGQFSADPMDEEESGVARLDEIESGDESEEEGYESSFIDDDVGNHGRVMGGHRSTEVISIDSDSDNDSLPVPQTRRGGRNRANVINDDDGDGESGHPSDGTYNTYPLVWAGERDARVVDGGWHREL